MRFNSHTKFSLRASFAILMSLIWLFALPKLPFHAYADGQVSVFKGTTGVAKIAERIDPQSLPDVHMQGKSSHMDFPASLPKQEANLAESSIYARTTSIIPFAMRNPLHNFDGVSAADSQKANGITSEVPDEGFAVGNGYVLNIVNLAGSIYHTNGTVIVAPFSLYSFFDEPTSAVMGGERAYYDKSTRMWIALTSTIDLSSGQSHLDLAINTSGNPTRLWTIYRIDTTDSMSANCPCLAVYPALGIDQYNVYITGDEYALSGSYQGAEIYTVAKSLLATLSPTLSFVHFGDLSVGGVPVTRLQPTITYGIAPAEYFMNSSGSNLTTTSQLNVWALTNQQKVAQGGLPTLSVTSIQSESYGRPVNAPTPLNGNTLSANGDDSIENVEYIHGHLLGVLDTSITLPGASSTRDGVAWFIIKPQFAGQSISNNSRVVDQGYTVSHDGYLLFPHIEESVNGVIAIGFSFTGPNTYPSAAYTVRSDSTHTFSGITIAAGGQAADGSSTCQSNKVCSWGDYSAGQLDPSTLNIWFATAYIPKAGILGVNWGNRIFEINVR